MLELLKHLLGKRKESTGLNISSVEVMNFPEILDLVRRLPDSIEVNQGTTLTKRLYEIALFDNHVSIEHRSSAADLLKVLKNTVEQSLKDNPEALAAYQKGNSFMEGNVHLHGVGSLPWLIKENKVAPKDILAFITRPEHMPLLNNFYASFVPSERKNVQQQVEMYLRRQ